MTVVYITITYVQVNNNIKHQGHVSSFTMKWRGAGQFRNDKKLLNFFELFSSNCDLSDDWMLAKKNISWNEGRKEKLSTFHLWVESFITSASDRFSVSKWIEMLSYPTSQTFLLFLFLHLSLLGVDCISWPTKTNVEKISFAS